MTPTTPHCILRKGDKLVTIFHAPIDAYALTVTFCMAQPRNIATMLPDPIEYRWFEGDEMGIHEAAAVAGRFLAPQDPEMPNRCWHAIEDFLGKFPMRELEQDF